MSEGQREGGTQREVQTKLEHETRQAQHPFALHLRSFLCSREPARLAPVRQGEAPLTPASVLIPLFAQGPSGPVELWLVRRSADLRVHRGQVALPGGKREVGDSSTIATALREAHEEIGLAPSSVDVLGALDDFSTITGFVVSPQVGWIVEPFVPRPCMGEVARVFAVPLRDFLGPPLAQRVVPELAGRGPVAGYEMEGEFVWGATAGILRGFVRALPERLRAMLLVPPST